MGFVSLEFKVHTKGYHELDEILKYACTEAEHSLAVQMMKDTNDFVPFLNGHLSNYTYTVENTIVYPGPYARYLYNGKVMVDSVTGKGPMHFVDKLGNEKIKFRKGATLKATNRDLDIKFNKGGHRHAQSHWYEASKAQNLDKWIHDAEKAVKNDLKS